MLSLKLNPKRLVKLLFISVIIILVSFSCCYQAIAYTPSKIVVEKKIIYINNLPVAFENFKIVQLSDLHYGRVVSIELIEKVVSIANSLSPDIIAITGDLANGVNYYPECFKVLNQLKAYYGTFLVSGNRETSYSLSKIKVLMAQTNIKFLNDSYELLNKGTDSIYIAGINYDGGYGTKLADVFNDIDNKYVKILLSHNPYVVANINNAKKDIDLILSGHTHGGEVVYPIIGAIKVPEQFGLRFVSGLYKYGKTQVYVNRGIGVIESKPYRINCSPEVTLIILKRKPLSKRIKANMSS